MTYRTFPQIGLILLCAIGASLNAASAQTPAAHKIAFERDDGIWIANLDGSSAKKVGVGQGPDLTIDGTKLTYNTSDYGASGSRHIAVVDLASGKTTVLKSLPCDNCFAPRWSPDGKQILVEYDTGDNWRLGLVSADDSSFREVKSAQFEPINFWGAAWAPDGQSFFAQDMESLYRIDLNGNVLNKWLIKDIIPNSDVSSDNTIEPSPDGKSLLISVGMDEDVVNGWEGALPAIWLFDLTTQKATRLTPPTLYAWNGVWLNAPHSILYVTAKVHQDSSTVYQMSTTGQGKDRKVALKNAGAPRVSP